MEKTMADGKTSQEIFHNGREGTLGLPIGDFEVVQELNGRAVAFKYFSDTKVRDLNTGKEYLIPTGNAQLIFGVCGGAY
jgi:hypothetical protein